MQKFNFISPGSIEEVCEVLAEYKERARVIAGGTDLMPDLRREDFAEPPELIVDISRVEKLNYIKNEDNYLKIGGTTTHAQLAASIPVNKYAGVLATAASCVGSPQIRNRGTVAGNIITASPAADTVPALMALDADLVLQKTGQTRTIPLADFFRGPYRVKNSPEEIIREILVKKLPQRIRGYFTRVTRRQAVDKARINIAVIAGQDSGGKIDLMRIVPGSVTPVPQRFQKPEELLMNKIPDKCLLEKAAAAAAGEMVSITGQRWSTDYKKPVIEKLVYRALMQVLEVSG